MSAGPSGGAAATRSHRISLLLVLALQGPAAAQCVNLGTPGTAGCPLVGFPPPILQCIGSPNVGNPIFAVATTFYCPPCPGNACSTPVLLAAPCASPPIPLPTGPLAFCSSTGSCVAFVVPTSLALLPPQFPGVWVLPIPNNPSLVGATVCTQLVGFATGGPSCPGGCLILSHGLQMILF